MATNIISTTNVVVSGNGTTATTQNLEVAAFSKIDVLVEAESGGTPGSASVDVNPGATNPTFLLITADAYPAEADGTAQLTFEVDGSGTDVGLNGPLLLAGPGAVGLLGTGGVQDLVFSNASDEDRNVQIQVGRDADVSP